MCIKKNKYIYIYQQEDGNSQITHDLCYSFHLASYLLNYINLSTNLNKSNPNVFNRRDIHQASIKASILTCHTSQVLVPGP